ncbi:reverse transcriptase domain-containing protein [Tanacetum coccineum]
MAWVKWSQVLPSFDKRGLNIGSLKAFNLALLQKWRWRMFSSPNTLWVNTIKALHGQDGGLDNKGCNFNGTWSRIVGDNILLRKVNIFFWRLSLDRLPHRLNLSACGIEIPTTSCSSCNGNVKSTDHIFFACDLVKDVWSLVCKWCDLFIPLFESYDAWKGWICSWHVPKLEDCFWYSLESTDPISYPVYHTTSVGITEQGDDSSSDEWKDYGMAGDDYEGPPIFDDDQYEEESMPVYDTDIEDVIEEEEVFIEKGRFGGKEDNIEDVVVMANDLYSSMIQTTCVNFSKIINSNPHELIWFQKVNLVEVSILIGKKYHEGYLKDAPMDDKLGFKTIKLEDCFWYSLESTDSICYPVHFTTSLLLELHLQPRIIIE